MKYDKIIISDGTDTIGLSLGLIFELFWVKHMNYIETELTSSNFLGADFGPTVKISNYSFTPTSNGTKGIDDEDLLIALKFRNNKDLCNSLDEYISKQKNKIK